MNPFTYYFGSNVEFSEKDDLASKIKALAVACKLSGGEIDTLKAAWRDGLLESGDTPSKAGMDGLLEKGVLCQTCYSKSDYTFSVTYPFGFYVVKAINTIEMMLANAQGGE